MPLTTFRGIFISRLSYIFPTFHEIGPGDYGSPRAQTSFTANAYGDATASYRLICHKNAAQFATKMPISFCNPGKETYLYARKKLDLKWNILKEPPT